MISNNIKRIVISAFVLTLSFITLSANAIERTGCSSVPCDPNTDFSEIFMIQNWEKLPHKCQEESHERINEVNQILKKKKWSYSKNFPVLTCLSFATSEISDWWAMQYGWEIGTYTNFYNGKIENGFNPRELEVVYLHRSKKQYLKYPVVPLPDFVHKRPYPASNRGYARVVSEQQTEPLNDTILTDITYEYSKDKYPFEPGKWLRFKRGLKSNKKYTEILKNALHAHGPLLTHLEFVDAIKHLTPAIHSVMLVGYGKPLSNPDETVFILQDSYGDHPKDYNDLEGGPSYKYFKAKSLESVIAFPHTPVVNVKKNGGKLIITATNKAGEPIKVNTIAVYDTANKTNVKISNIPDKNNQYSVGLSSFSHDEGSVMVYIAAEYYMKTPDEGYWFNLKY